MNASEFKRVLVDLGKRDVTDQQVSDMLSQVDKNNDSVIQWNEFLEVIPSSLGKLDVQVTEELKPAVVCKRPADKRRVRV